MGVSEVLEEVLGRPVTTANQVLECWAALRAASSDAEVRQYVRLFDLL